MYVYNLSVAMANKKFSFEQCPEMIDIIKEAITISNSSFSATRYKRSIEFKELIDEKHVLLIIKSRDEINPTRSLSSLSRAVFNVEKERKTSFLSSCTANGCLFNAVVIDAPSRPISIEELSDSILLKSIIDLVYSSNESQKQKLKEFMLPLINEKKETVS